MVMRAADAASLLQSPITRRRAGLLTVRVSQLALLALIAVLVLTPRVLWAQSGVLDTGQTFDKDPAQTVNQVPSQAPSQALSQAPDRALPQTADIAKNPALDVRVLIDVSGSMRKTDPLNLRRPALELLVQLLAQDTRAGVWQFGEVVTPLTPFAGVSEVWRSQAQAAVATIASRELHTDIAAALAAAEQAGSPVAGQTHIILLTDGKLDVGADAARNAAAREQLLREQLPRLVTSGIKIHSIALSRDADAALLQSLSQATDGLFATALVADDLIGIFAKIFAQASAQDELPLTENRFLVDASIEEFSALLFRKSGQQRVQLTAPNGLQLQVDSAPSALGGIATVAETLPDTVVMNPDFNRVRWWRGANYDLVTVTQPTAGEWLLGAPVRAGSRVSIVSNFKLRIDPLKTQVAVGDSPRLGIRLEAEGAPLTDADFLAMLNAEVHLQPAAGATAPAEIVAKIQGTQFDEGRVEVMLVPFTLDSPTQLQVRVDGKSFARQFTHEFQISQARFAIEQTGSASDAGYRERISIRALQADLTELRASAAITHNGQPLTTQDATPDPANPAQLIIEFTTQTPGTYSMAIAVSAFSESGAPVWETKLTQPFTLEPPAPVADAQAWYETWAKFVPLQSLTTSILLGAAGLLSAALALLILRRRRKATLPPKRNHFAVVRPLSDAPDTPSDTTLVMMDFGADSNALILDDPEPSAPDEAFAPIFPLDDLSDTENLGARR